MARFKDMKTLQKFAAVHASIHNHFNHDRHLNRRDPSSKSAAPRWPSGDNWRPEYLRTAAFAGQPGLL